jgi:hypothetical protein
VSLFRVKIPIIFLRISEKSRTILFWAPVVRVLLIY